MLQEFNLLLASAVVLAFLVWVLALPFFAAWWLLSVRRSLARLADSQETVARYAQSMLAEADMHERVAIASDRRRIANSAFGR